MNENKLIKKEIIEIVSEKLNYTKKDVDIILNHIFDTLKTAILEERIIEIRGFGTFYIKETKEKNRYNFKTKKSNVSKSSKIVKFKAGAEISESLNQ